MSTTERPFRSEARSRLRPSALAAALVAALVVVLAACGGGGGGGGGGDSALKLRVAVINETSDDLAISLDATEPGEPQTLATCRGEVYAFDLPEGEEWVLTLNGQTVIDSLDLEANLIDRNLTAEVQANEDGTVKLERIQAGSQVSRPAQLGICT
jgi:hypothetical protein